MTLEFKKLLEFTRLTTQFRGIERKIKLLKEQRWENDAEHSFQLALVAWYIVQNEKLNLDTNKVVKYAMAHDLIEVYAGDTPLHHSTAEHQASKAEREKKAIVQLQQEFPEMSEIHEAITSYEQRTDAESKFVYALDKLLPPLMVYLDDGFSWKETDVTLAMVIERKMGKVNIDPTVGKFFDELLVVLKENEHRLFNK